MPYPNKPQWIIIWATVLVAAHLWMGLSLDDLWPGSAAGGWGLPAYLSPARYPQPDETPKLAVTILAVGLLLTWMASGKRSSGAPPSPRSQPQRPRGVPAGPASPEGHDKGI